MDGKLGSPIHITGLRENDSVLGMNHGIIVRKKPEPRFKKILVPALVYFYGRLQKRKIIRSPRAPLFHEQPDR